MPSIPSRCSPRRRCGNRLVACASARCGELQFDVVRARLPPEDGSGTLKLAPQAVPLSVNLPSHYSSFSAVIEFPPPYEKHAARVGCGVLRYAGPDPVRRRRRGDGGAVRLRRSRRSGARRLYQHHLRLGPGGDHGDLHRGPHLGRSHQPSRHYRARHLSRLPLAKGRTLHRRAGARRIPRRGAGVLELRTCLPRRRSTARSHRQRVHHVPGVSGFPVSRAAGSNHRYRAAGVAGAGYHRRAQPASRGEPHTGADRRGRRGHRDVVRRHAWLRHKSRA